MGVRLRFLYEFHSKRDLPSDIVIFSYVTCYAFYFKGLLVTD